MRAALPRAVQYVMLLPDGTRAKLAAWARNQQADGMLAEQIDQQRPDEPSGRVMADSTSMFVLYVLELLRWDGDSATAQRYYPTVKRAAQWQMNASAVHGVPRKLQTSYDILDFPKYELSAYASAFHLLAMAAAAELADFAGDAPFAAECRAALATAQRAFDALQYNAAGGYYWASSSNCTAAGGCAASEGLFADSFYAQVLAYSALGPVAGQLLADATRLDAHLAAEAKANCVHTDLAGGAEGALRAGCPNGLVVMTARPVGPTDLQVWQMATYDHATLAIRRSDGGMRAGRTAPAVIDALELARGAATAPTERLRDQWNIAGLHFNDGHPATTSHCAPRAAVRSPPSLSLTLTLTLALAPAIADGAAARSATDGMHMVLWHLPLALSGQLADLTRAPNRSLTFEPKLACPFTLPVLLPRALGALECAADRTVTLRFTRTRPGLVVDHLAVAGVAYPKLPVALDAGAPPLVWRA